MATVLLTACKKNDLNESKRWAISDVTNAWVKYHNSYTALTPSLGVPANGPSVNFYVNNVKMNGPTMAYGSFFPNVTGGGAFAAAPSGQVNIKAVLNRTTGTGLPSDTIASYNFGLGASKSHSVILIDEMPNPTPDNPNMLVIQEDVAMPAYGKFKLRLLNLIATTEVFELYNSTTATIVVPSVKFKDVSNWVELPVPASGNVFQIRLAGTTTVMATASSFTPANQRSYTFWARGNPAVSGRARTLSQYITQ